MDETRRVCQGWRAPHCSPTTSQQSKRQSNTNPRRAPARTTLRMHWRHLVASEGPGRSNALVTVRAGPRAARVVCGVESKRGRARPAASSCGARRADAPNASRAQRKDAGGNEITTALACAGRVRVACGLGRAFTRPELRNAVDTPCVANPATIATSASPRADYAVTSVCPLLRSPLLGGASRAQGKAERQQTASGVTRLARGRGRL